MTISQGDIKIVASQVMDDVDEGGGAPTSVEIRDGVSNDIFTDISEADRAVGRINLRKINVSVQTPDRDRYLGANVIVAEPPNDPNVSITIFKAGTPFDRRTDAQDTLESYSIKGPVWGGYLLENHVAGMRSVQLFQRPGNALPTINRTLVLVQNEGLPSEVEQYVRVTKVESEVRTFTEIVNGEAVNFLGEVVTLSLSDRLRHDFNGSPASRSYAPQAGKALVRDTVVADAGVYSGVVPLQVASEIGDVEVKATSVYTQLVPSARTETSILDQRPASERTLTLATTPRNVTVGVAPHTYRIRIGQENRGYDFVQILQPFPAPNTVVIAFRALGNWYTATDDGAGKLVGSAVGTVNYANGSIAVTLSAMPDIGTSIIFSWGEASGFVNRSNSGAQVRPPEYAFVLDHTAGIVPGSVEITWLSAGALKTAVAGTNGRITGDATGEVQHALGRVILRPTAMIDAGGEFNIAYEQSNTVTKEISSVSVDDGGFATLALDTVPMPGSVSVRWITVRSVSNSSGATADGSAANKTSSGNETYNTSFMFPQVPVVSGGGGNVIPPAPPVEVPRTPTAVSNPSAPVTDATAKPPMMAPGGYPPEVTEDTGPYVFVAAPAVLDPTTGAWAYNYPKADSDGNLPVWTQAEYAAGQKTINGVLYTRWGQHLA
ncbi:hypothetical protein [Acidovorax phage ACPWH]|nr:hypothetical protein [Acidovorax phage ACPWH]